MDKTPGDSMVFEGEWYHVYNRGANKETIFHDSHDYDRFVKGLYISNTTKPYVFRDIRDVLLFDIQRPDTLVSILAYVLMPNHFHILMKENVFGGKKMFLRKLCTGYTMYYNKKYKHSGVVFQGDSKSKYIDDDVYFQYMATYIHMNPVKMIEPLWKTKESFDIQKVTLFLNEYKYSSYIDYLQNKKQREQSLILSQEDGFAQKYFHKNQKELVEEWLAIRSTE